VLFLFFLLPDRETPNPPPVVIVHQRGDPLAAPHRVLFRRLSRLRPLPLLLRIVQIDIEPKRAHLLDQHIEAFRDARLKRVVAPYDRLVHFGAASNVVGLDSQHLLQSVGSTVSFERPNFHFAKALAAELRLSAEWLLSN